MWNLVFLRDKWKVFGEPWLALYLTFRVTSINKVEQWLQDQVNSLCFYCVMICLSSSIIWNPIFSPLTQAHKCIFAILIPTASTTCPSTGSSSSLEFSRHWISASPRLFMCRETTSWIWEGFGFISRVMSIFQIMCSYWLYKLDIYNKPISFDWSHTWDARLFQQLKNKSAFSEEDHITNALMLRGCVILHSLHVLFVEA